jgi:5-methylcytosine-specific restriction enzyme subunit McrC
MEIPVANIYYLLCYAWDEFAPRLMTDVAVEEFTDTLDLFSHLLLVGIRALHRRGFETGYNTIEEGTSTVRGRILIGQSTRLFNAQPKRLQCAYDEIGTDTLTNQILKATVMMLLGEQRLKNDRRVKLRHALRLLRGVSDIKLNARMFHGVRLHQNNRLYSFLTNVCRFFCESLEAQDRPGQYRFRDVDRDEKRMRKVFQKFVLRFFNRRQNVFKAKSEQSDWFAAALPGSDMLLLPKLVTDVTLRSVHRTIIIECKYTKSLFQKRFFADRFRSPHLYQLCAYLRNLEHHGGPDQEASGILLYPTAGIEVDQSYRLHGHRVRIKTIDLYQAWTDIEADMLSLLEPPCAA